MNKSLASTILRTPPLSENSRSRSTTLRCTPKSCSPITDNHDYSPNVFPSVHSSTPDEKDIQRWLCTARGNVAAPYLRPAELSSADRLLTSGLVPYYSYDTKIELYFVNDHKRIVAEFGKSLRDTVPAQTSSHSDHGFDFTHSTFDRLLIPREVGIMIYLPHVTRQGATMLGIMGPAERKPKSCEEGCERTAWYYLCPGSAEAFAKLPKSHEIQLLATLNQGDLGHRFWWEQAMSSTACSSPYDESSVDCLYCAASIASDTGPLGSDSRATSAIDEADKEWTIDSIPAASIGIFDQASTRRISEQLRSSQRLHQSQVCKGKRVKYKTNCHELFTKRRRTPGSACSKPLQRPAWVKNDYFMLHKQDPARLVHYDTKNEPILPKTYQECQLPSSMSSLSHEGCDKGDQNYDPRGCPNKASCLDHSPVTNTFRSRVDSFMSLTEQLSPTTHSELVIGTQDMMDLGKPYIPSHSVNEEIVHPIGTSDLAREYVCGLSRMSEISVVEHSQCIDASEKGVSQVSKPIYDSHWSTKGETLSGETRPQRGSNSGFVNSIVQAKRRRSQQRAVSAFAELKLEQGYSSFESIITQDSCREEVPFGEDEDGGFEIVSELHGAETGEWRWEHVTQRRK